MFCINHQLLEKGFYFLFVFAFQITFFIRQHFVKKQTEIGCWRGFLMWIFFPLTAARQKVQALCKLRHKNRVNWALETYGLLQSLNFSNYERLKRKSRCTVHKCLQNRQNEWKFFKSKKTSLMKNCIKFPMALSVPKNASLTQKNCRNINNLHHQMTSTSISRNIFVLKSI